MLFEEVELVNASEEMKQEELVAIVTELCNLQRETPNEQARSSYIEDDYEL